MTDRLRFRAPSRTCWRPLCSGTTAAMLRASRASASASSIVSVCWSRATPLAQRMPVVTVQHVGAELRELRVHRRLRAAAEREHGDHRGDADDDAEHRERGAEHVAAHRVEREPHRLPERHQRLRAGAALAGAGRGRLLRQARDAAAAAREVLDLLLDLDEARGRQQQHCVALREAAGDLDAVEVGDAGLDGRRHLAAILQRDDPEAAAERRARRRVRPRRAATPGGARRRRTDRRAHCVGIEAEDPRGRVDVARARAAP